MCVKIVENMVIMNNELYTTAPNQTRRTRRVKRNQSIFAKIKSSFTAIWMCILAIILAYLYYKAKTLKTPCGSHIDHEVIVQALKEKLLGQDEAIAGIEKALVAESKNKIMAFIGGTGQGKTYAADIMGSLIGIPGSARLYKENFKDFISKEYAQGLTSHCNYSLIVLDDLNLRDIKDAVLLPYYAFITSQVKGNITLLFIFNIEYVDSNFVLRKNYEHAVEEIQSHMDVFETPTFIAKFYDMDKEGLSLCIKKAMEQYSVNLSEKSTNELMKLRNCKDIFSKVRTLY